MAKSSYRPQLKPRPLASPAQRSAPPPHPPPPPANEPHAAPIRRRPNAPRFTPGVATLSPPQDYNKIAKALRGDEETKSELHQRVDDIRDRLWTICDEKKQAAEYERDAILCDGWLTDHLSLLTNAFVTLMQAEVDRLNLVGRRRYPGFANSGAVDISWYFSF